VRRFELLAGEGASIMDHVQLGKRLRNAREHRGLSQQHVADALALPRTAITLLESGQRQVSTVELTKFASLYRRPIAEFLNPIEDVPENYRVVLHRHLPQIRNGSHVREEVDKCLELCRLGVELEGILGQEARQGPPSFSVAQPKSAGDAVLQGFEVAEEERRRLGLGYAPIRNIMALISAQGIWAVTSELLDEMSGLFMHDPEIGLVVIANARHRASRQRFSFAHEYGHALMDRDKTVQVTSTSNANELIEKRANAFAAAFLLPPNGVEHFLQSIDKGRASRQQQAIYDVASDGRFDVESRAAPNSQTITYQDVVTLAERFGASYEATTYRLNNLAYTNRTETQHLLDASPIATKYAQLLRKNGPSNEADQRPNELRLQIARLAMEAYRREEISRGRLLEIGRQIEIPGPTLIELAEAARAN
jgi:Zn-dependent peptidase ImmA (M78 family)